MFASGLKSFYFISSNSTHSSSNYYSYNNFLIYNVCSVVKDMTNGAWSQTVLLGRFRHLKISETIIAYGRKSYKEKHVSRLCSKENCRVHYKGSYLANLGCPTLTSFHKSEGKKLPKDKTWSP